MDNDILATVEQIKAMTRKYRTMPGKPIDTVNALLDEVEIIRQKVDRSLAAFNSSIDDRDPGLVQMIGEALQEAREASVTAQLHLERELEDIRDAMGQIRTGNKARRAYQTPRVGMGYTEGNFIDRKK